MKKRFPGSIFNVHKELTQLCTMKIEYNEAKLLLEKSRTLGKIGFLGLMLTANANSIPLDIESSVQNNDTEDVVIEDEFRNDISVGMNAAQIKELKGSYISPYNYLQDPIASTMGYDSRTDSAGGTYHGGFSVAAGQNRQVGQSNMSTNTNIAQIWGQTGRLGGFALGGGATAVFNVNNGGSGGQTDTFRTIGQLVPTQAYINYQYSNKVDITAGNILLTTPWVNSMDNAPAATYAVGSNTYQGALINVQALPSLLVTAFSAVGYLQYPNSGFGPQNYYNTNSGPLYNTQPTSGTSGVGLTWNPVNSYTGQLWFYNFGDYANMAYIDNSYHVDLSKLFSLDFGLQAFAENSAGSVITNQVTLPGQTTPAGYVSSNGLGLKMALNIGDNTSSISFNNVFGSNGSFLNGGVVTPYTYDMETDPLYTTPAITSLAELGSGWAYTIRNSTAFMEKSLKFNLSMSQFFVNQVYASQVTQVTEYDSSLLYRIPHTNMNIWTRLVYLQQPSNYGGDMWQPRVIFNWTY